MLLDGKVAIVTGADPASGGRRRCAWRARREVVVADIDGDGADAVAAEVTAAGGEATSVVVDVAEEASVRGMVEVACTQYGGVDVLHNNAAAVGADEVAKDVDLLDLDVGVWDRTMAVNVRGPCWAASTPYR